MDLWFKLPKGSWNHQNSQLAPSQGTSCRRLQTPSPSQEWAVLGSALSQLPALYPSQQKWDCQFPSTHGCTWGVISAKGGLRVITAPHKHWTKAGATWLVDVFYKWETSERQPHKKSEQNTELGCQSGHITLLSLNLQMHFQPRAKIINWRWELVTQSVKANCTDSWGYNFHLLCPAYSAALYCNFMALLSLFFYSIKLQFYFSKTFHRFIWSIVLHIKKNQNYQGGKAQKVRNWNLVRDNSPKPQK